MICLNQCLKFKLSEVPYWFIQYTHIYRGGPKISSLGGPKYKKKKIQIDIHIVLLLTNYISTKINAQNHCFLRASIVAKNIYIYIYLFIFTNQNLLLLHSI